MNGWQVVLTLSMKNDVALRNRRRKIKEGYGVKCFAGAVSGWELVCLMFGLDGYFKV